MALSYSKPIKRPDWGDTSTNIVEPSAGFKDAGWGTNDVHVSSYENWKANNISDWFKWFDERFDDGASTDILKLNAAFQVDSTLAAAANSYGLNVTAKGTGDGIQSFGGDSNSGGGAGGVLRGGIGGTTSTGGRGIDARGGKGGSTSGIHGPGGYLVGSNSLVGNPGNAGEGVICLGGNGYSTSVPGIGGAFTGGDSDSGSNVSGAFGISSVGGKGDGTGFNGPGVVGLGDGISFTVTAVEAGAGVVGSGSFVVGANNAGGPGGVFYGKTANVSGDGGHGVVGYGGNRAGSDDGGYGVFGLGGSNAAPGVVGFGYSTTVTSVTSPYGVYGEADAADGVRGVTTANAWGVYGKASGDSPDGGVFGEGNDHSSGGDGGLGIKGVGGAGNGAGYDGWGVAGFGTGASATIDINSQGSGLFGEGSSNGGYGAWLEGAAPRAALHLKPQTAPTTAVVGDLYVDSSGILYSCTNATGPVWTKVGTQT
jgi:hypothetical protein